MLSKMSHEWDKDRQLKSHFHSFDGDIFRHSSTWNFWLILVLVNSISSHNLQLSAYKQRTSPSSQELFWCHQSEASSRAVFRLFQVVHVDTATTISHQNWNRDCNPITVSTLLQIINNGNDLCIRVATDGWQCVVENWRVLCFWFETGKVCRTKGWHCIISTHNVLFHPWTFLVDSFWCQNEVDSSQQDLHLSA